jgi:hypothetical protein
MKEGFRVIRECAAKLQARRNSLERERGLIGP